MCVRERERGGGGGRWKEGEVEGERESYNLLILCQLHPHQPKQFEALCAGPVLPGCFAVVTRRLMTHALNWAFFFFCFFI